MRKTLFGPVLLALLTVSGIGSATSIPSCCGGSCRSDRVSLPVVLPLQEMDSVRLDDEEQATTEAEVEVLRLVQALQVLDGDGFFVGAAALLNVSEAGFDGGCQMRDEIPLQHVRRERGVEIAVNRDLDFVVRQVGEDLCSQ